MTKSIAPWMANDIWHVLVEECGARRGDVHAHRHDWTEEYSFINYLEGDGGGFGHEFRFMGALGFGGKFYNDGTRWRVGCYREDETPVRAEMIRRANERLAILKQLYKI